MDFKIAAVFVLYNQDEDKFYRSYQSLKDQVNAIIVYNNGKNDFTTEDEKTTVIAGEKNIGIAAAQNRAAEAALKAAADYILFSDQDTVYPPDYVSRMMSILQKEEKSRKVSCLAPQFYSEVAKVKPPFMTVKDGVCVQQNVDSGTKEVFFTISSGQIMSAASLKDIGLFKEDFFIDWVDIEWCFRAMRKGYVNLQTADVEIKHSLGDDRVKFFRYSLTKHSQKRNYYYIRNGNWLVNNGGLTEAQKQVALPMLKSNTISAFICHRPHFFKTFSIYKKALNDAKNNRLGE